MKDFFRNAKFAKKYFKGQGLRMFFILLTSFISLVISIILPIFSAQLIIKVTSNLFTQVISISILLFVIKFIDDTLWTLGTLVYEKVYAIVYSRIQNDVGSSILKLTNNTLDDNASGVFITRLTSDTNSIASSFEGLIRLFNEILTSVGTLFAVFFVSWQAGIFTIVSVVVVLILSYIRVKIHNEQDRELRKINEKTNGFLSEIIRGSRDIKMLNSEHSFLSELKKKVDYNNQEKYKVKATNRMLWLLIFYAYNFFENSLYIFLVILIMNNQLTVALALVVNNYSQRAKYFADAVGYFIETFKEFNLSCSRVFDIINSDEFKKEEFGLTQIEGNFEFKHVEFGYNKKQKVLKDLSFKVDSNTTVGFVGKSGEGKTTIFSLLCKMYDVNKGEILIDGNNIKDLDKDTIRGNITIISQDPYIFNVSIKDNLKLVKENVTMREIREACKMACLDDFIESLPDKYNTIVGEGGVNLSGGQRQRLAIARAFVQKTEIILFDEATSALDNETQNGIQQAIRNLKKDYTIMIIAHRLSTIKDCDKIFFISDGKVKASGTHEELLKKSKDYRELYESEIEK